MSASVTTKRRLILMYLCSCGTTAATSKHAIAALSDTPDDRTLECLAFAQGRLLWIHPFEDFNGRLTRAFLAELLQRLDMPALDPTPDPGPDTERYLQALKAADRADWGPLVTVWRGRFEKEAGA